MARIYEQQLSENVKKMDAEHSLSPQQENEKRMHGYWIDQEQNKYVVFLDLFQEELQSKHKRKLNKIYKIMAEFLQTRDAVQCRSHHIKQLRSYGTIKKIIKRTKKSVGETYYNQILKEVCSGSNFFFKNRIVGQSLKGKVKKLVTTCEIGIQTTTPGVEMSQVSSFQPYFFYVSPQIPQQNYTWAHFLGSSQFPPLERRSQ